MAVLKFKDQTFESVGELPKVGTTAPEFIAVKNDFSDSNIKDYLGNKVILNIFPSLDTPVCANSVRKFNTAANALKNTKILCISMDLPYAMTRFCVAENLENVVSLSTFRNPEFGEKYGVTISNGPAKGLLSRAIVVLDKDGKVIYTEQVYEISEEPNYDKALAAVK